MNRSTMITVGLALVGVAAVMHFQQPSASSSLPSIPTWLLGGGGVIAALMGWFKGGDSSPTLPPPDPKSMTITNLIKAFTDGNITAEDKLMLYRFLGGGGVIDGVVDPSEFPGIDLNKVRVIIDQVIQIVAASEEFKKRGFPPYTSILFAWDAKTILPVSWGVDPRPTPAPIPVPSPTPVTP